jgi:maltooligosyltrehalose trehalohydrolase
VYCQNHDQIGNRARGERLSALVNFEAQKLAAGMTLLSPFTPLLFMGQEYGELAPFQYFTSHGDKNLVEAVRRGRREEFNAFGWKGELTDPQDEKTFLNSRLQHRLRDTDPHRTLRLFYQELIRFRRENQLGADAELEITESEKPPVLIISRPAMGGRLLMIFNFDEGDVQFPAMARNGHWTTELSSADSRWLGPNDRFPQAIGPSDTPTLAGKSFVVLRQDGTG